MAVEPSKPNTTVAQPGKSYYTPSEIQQWQSVHGPGSMPPGYTPPQTKPSIPSPPPPEPKPIPQEKQVTLKENVNISAYDPEQVSRAYTPPKEINRVDKTGTLTFLQQAKESGLTNVDIYNQKGEKIGSTNPQNVLQARKDILIAIRSSGGPVTTKATTTKTEVTSSRTTFEQSGKTDTAKEAAAAFLAPAAEVGLGFLELGKEIVTGKYVTGKDAVSQKMQEIHQQVEKTYGTKAANPLDTLANKDVPLIEKLAYAEGAAAFFGIGVVGGGKAVKPEVSESTVSKIITGVKEAEEIKPISQTVTTKASTKFEQVGIAKTEEGVNPQIKQQGPQIIREEGLVRAEVPKMPPSGPTAKITQKEALGEPNIPITTIAKTTTSYYRSPLSSLELKSMITTEKSEIGLQENPLEGKIIVQEPTPKQVTELGLTKMEGLIRTYTGKLTEETSTKLESMMRKYQIEEIGTILKTSTKEAEKAPELIAFGVGKPEAFSKYTDLVRPEVTRVFTGPQRYIKLAKEESTQKLPEDIFKEDTAKGTGEIKPHALFVKPTQEEIQSRYPLMTIEQKSEELRKLAENISGLTEEKPLGYKESYTGLVTKGSLLTEETQILKYPPETKTVLGTKELESNVTDLLSRTDESQISKQKENTSLISLTGLRSLTGLQSKTEQTTKQETSQVTEEILRTETPTKTQTTTRSPGIINRNDEIKRYKKFLKAKSKEKQSFIGNAPLTDIVGIYKREEITYGEKVSKLASKDIRRSERGSPRLVKEKRTKILDRKPEFIPSKQRKIKL